MPGPLTRLLAVALGLAPIGGHAQGGPPLVTDDPETPGDGHWEINVATITERTREQTAISAADADINYGWGDRIQLKLDLPFEIVHTTDTGSRAGLGVGDLGVKWRFIDRGEDGLTVSTYPQFLSSWISSSTQRGVADRGHQFFMPLEAALPAGEFHLDMEAGRNYMSLGSNQWITGAVVGHACGPGAECLFEVRETIAPHASSTLVNVGLHYGLTKSLILLAAVGRDFGPMDTDPRRALVYLGIQVLR